MDEAISIGGDGAKINFCVLGYENPSAQNTEDANWLEASLQITAGPFIGSINFSLTTHELISLYSQINNAVQSLQDNIDFETMDSNWSFHVKFETTGSAVAKGIVTAHPISGNALQ